MQLTLCMQAVNKLASSRERNNPTARQARASSRFEDVICHLRAKPMMAVGLTGWADTDLRRRAGLHELKRTGENKTSTWVRPGSHIPPRGHTSIPSLLQARLDVGHVGYPDRPKKDLSERRRRALELRAQGMSYPQIARELGISVGSAWNAVNRHEMPE